METIYDPRIIADGTFFLAKCQCGNARRFSNKNNARKMLDRGNCRSCKQDYRSLKDHEISIYSRSDGKWCSVCSGCGTEQAYTRKDHARQSSVADWQCKTCVAQTKGFSDNKSVGNERRLFNKYSKSAESRGIEWRLSFEEMFQSYNGVCALTGWEISMGAKNQTASLDRIDSRQCYEPSNVQWVHSMVNMAKNKYDQRQFFDMCCAVANKVAEQ